MRDTFFCGKESPLVETGRGPVRGYRDGGLDIFKGIPYGRARRFHRPEKYQTRDRASPTAQPTAQP